MYEHGIKTKMCSIYFIGYINIKITSKIIIDKKAFPTDATRIEEW